jgi:hypothetical protein
MEIYCKGKNMMESMEGPTGPTGPKQIEKTINKIMNEIFSNSNEEKFVALILCSLKKNNNNDTNTNNKDKVVKKRIYKKIIRCGNCINCNIPECNNCKNCLDKPVNGGTGRRKQLCLFKKELLCLKKNYKK